MEQKKVCVGVVGAGAISDIYLKNMINRFDNLSVKSICAAHLKSAQKKAKEYGIQAVTMEEMLDDPEIRMIVNLTPAHIHYSVIRSIPKRRSPTISTSRQSWSGWQRKKGFILDRLRIHLWVQRSRQQGPLLTAECWGRSIPLRFLLTGIMISC